MEPQIISLILLIRWTPTKINLNALNNEIASGVFENSRNAICKTVQHPGAFLTGFVLKNLQIRTYEEFWPYNMEFRTLAGKTRDQF